MDGEVRAVAEALEAARAGMEAMGARWHEPHHRPPTLHLLVGRGFEGPAFFDDGRLFSFADMRVRKLFYGGAADRSVDGGGVDEDQATPDDHIDRAATAALSNVDAVFGHLSKVGHLRRSAPLLRPPAVMAPRVKDVGGPGVSRPPASSAFRFTA